MEVSKREVAEINYGNWFFANVAYDLRKDFMEQGARFYRQGVEAEWKEGQDLFTRDKQIILRVRRDGYPEAGGVVLFPARMGGVNGIEVLVRKGEGFFRSYLYVDELSEYRAASILRMVCVAMFGIENKEE